MPYKRTIKTGDGRASVDVEVTSEGFANRGCFSFHDYEPMLYVTADEMSAIAIALQECAAVMREENEKA